MDSENEPTNALTSSLGCEESNLLLHLLEHCPQPLLRYRGDRDLLYMNDSARAFLAMVSAENHAEAWNSLVQKHAGLDAPSSCEFKINHRFFQVLILPSLQHQILDVYLQEQTELQHERSKNSLQLQALQAAANAIFITDPTGKIEWTNDAFLRITGFSPEEAIGSHPRILKSGLHDQEFFERVLSQTTEGKPWKGWTINRHKTGHLYHVSESITAILDEDHKIQHFIVIYEDITSWVEAETRAARLAVIDPLTNLPNRTLFWQKLKDALNRLQRTDRHLAVLVIDLDHFKEINDALGHSYGDLLVVEVGRRFRNCLRGADSLARIGGDEFGVLLEMLHSAEEAAQVAQRLLDAIEEPIQIENHRVTISASIGISNVPGDEPIAEALLKHAEMAMYETKQAGKKSYQFFSSKMDEISRRKRSLEKDLREAIGKSQLWLAYQPKLHLQTNKISGAEALLRWKHPTKGFISPAEFIPIAERSKLILELGDWVLKEALRQSAAWKKQGLPSIPIAVNFSAAQFEQPHLSSYLRKCLDYFQLSSEMLEVEITESVMVNQSETVNQNLLDLEKMGITVAVDDFGIGYSSLKYLREFPISRLKIDMSFVQGIGKDRRDEAIVDAVIGLAHSLKLQAIAEGVECKEHIDYLKQVGCDQVQGYFIGKPLPAIDLENMLSQGLTLKI